MLRRGFIRNVASVATGIGLGANPLELLAKEDLVQISILHTNDIHCHVEPFQGSNERYSGKGGMARISELAKRARAANPNTLLFDAGDMFQGTPYFNYFKGELILKLMSEAGYDAGTIGNHEFDNGLQGILDPLPHAAFPLITSNYDFSDTILAGRFPRYKIFKRSGIRLGVYGLGIELEGLVAKNMYGGTRYMDPLTVAVEMEQFLKFKKDCDLVVCLSHLGHSYRGDKVSDKVLAVETSHTDLIIGGHSHTYMEEPLIEKNKNGNPVIVNQAWWGGLVIGKIDFMFERNRKRKETILADLISVE